MVLIAVVCCSSEKIRQKIICKGSVTVLSVEILPEKPEEPEKPKKPKVVIELPIETPKPPAPKPVPTPPPKVPQPAPPKPPPQAPAPPPPKASPPMVGFPPVPTDGASVSDGGAVLLSTILWRVWWGTMLLRVEEASDVL